VKARLKRKSFLIDERELGEARRALGAETDAETIREALRAIIRMSALARFMERTRDSLSPGNFS
jgi:Arc/MetJ family transcription regulator